MMRFLYVLVLSLSILVLLRAPIVSANHVDVKIDDDFRGDFDQDEVVKIKNPTDVQFSPDGTLMMVPDKDGTLYVVEDFEGSNPKTTKALSVSKICNNVERGFSGCAFHPKFGESNRYIYLYYTYDINNDCDSSGNRNRGPVNRLSRFVLGDNLEVDKSTEEVFFETPIMPYGSHNAGNIAFGQDGYLYVSVGDGGGGISTTNDDGVLYPQALDMLLGKILRLTDDGNIPPTNPFVEDKSERCNKDGWTSKPSIKCQEIYSYGLRNPFKFAMDVNNKKKTRFYINDVGRKTWESIREAGDGFGGANYGYPEREGPCKKKKATDCKPADEDEGFLEPIHWYIHDEEDGGAVTGGAFYPNDAGWHPSFQNSYIYADYAFGGVYRMVEGGEGCAYPKCDPPISPFADDLKVFSDYMRVTAIKFGPYKGGQALYVATRGHTGNNGDMGIFRVSYTGPLYSTDDVSSNGDGDSVLEIIAAPAPAPVPAANRPPKAVLTADITLGFPPMTVNFDATESFDPDTDGKGFALRYEWDFEGDGYPDESVSGPAVKHTYTKSGIYFAYVTVYDSQGAGDVTKIMIEVERAPPQPLIIEPDEDASFAVGDPIRLVGAGIDAEGGPPLPDRSFTWEVRMHHHEDHYHVIMEPTVGNHLELPAAPGPMDVESAKDTHLTVLLTVTDDTGLSMTTKTILRPKMVDLLFVTVPSGLILDVDGVEYTSPVALTTWENHRFEVEAPTQRKDTSTTQSRDESTTYIWESWSDGHAQLHDFVAHSSSRNTGATALVANFKILPFGIPSTEAASSTSSIRSNQGDDGSVSGAIASAVFIAIGAAGMIAVIGFVVWMLRRRMPREMDKDAYGATPDDECAVVEHAITDESRPSSDDGSDVEARGR